MSCTVAAARHSAAGVTSPSAAVTSYAGRKSESITPPGRGMSSGDPAPVLPVLQADSVTGCAIIGRVLVPLARSGARQGCVRTTPVTAVKKKGVRKSLSSSSGCCSEAAAGRAAYPRGAPLHAPLRAPRPGPLPGRPGQALVFDEPLRVLPRGYTRPAGGPASRRKPASRLAGLSCPRRGAQFGRSRAPPRGVPKAARSLQPASAARREDEGEEDEMKC